MLVVETNNELDLERSEGRDASVKMEEFNVKMISLAPADSSAGSSCDLKFSVSAENRAKK
jgi:hypothetical protein